MNKTKWIRITSVNARNLPQNVTFSHSRAIQDFMIFSIFSLQFEAMSVHKYWFYSLDFFVLQTIITRTTENPF